MPSRIFLDNSLFYGRLMNYERFDHSTPTGKKSIFLVNMTKEITPYFSQLTLQGIAKYLKQGKKMCILVNKK